MKDQEFTTNDKFEINTHDRRQFILTVHSFTSEKVLFKTHVKDTPDQVFDMELKIDDIKQMVSQNNMGLISRG